MILQRISAPIRAIALAASGNHCSRHSQGRTGHATEFIYLIPADRNADSAESSIKNFETSIPGREIELFRVSRAIGNLVDRHISRYSAESSSSILMRCSLHVTSCTLPTSHRTHQLSMKANNPMLNHSCDEKARNGRAYRDGVIESVVLPLEEADGQHLAQEQRDKRVTSSAEQATQCAATLTTLSSLASSTKMLMNSLVGSAVHAQSKYLASCSCEQ